MQAGKQAGKQAQMGAQERAVLYYRVVFRQWGHYEEREESLILGRIYFVIIYFLALPGVQGVKMYVCVHLSVCMIFFQRALRMALKGFLQHSKESRRGSKTSK